ncbi:MAG: hypothetical protein ACLTBV_27710 [Enterocloster bolteae]
MAPRSAFDESEDGEEGAPITAFTAWMGFPAVNLTAWTKKMSAAAVDKVEGCSICRFCWRFRENMGTGWKVLMHPILPNGGLINKASPRKGLAEGIRTLCTGAGVQSSDLLDGLR